MGYIDTKSGITVTSTDLTKIGGVAVSAKDAAFAEPPLGVGMEFEALGSLTTDGSAAGDKVPLKGSATGLLYVQVTNGTVPLDILTQDAAFGTGSRGLAVFGKYQATPTTYTDGDAAPILLDANGRIVLSSDIEIGSVELKDAAADTRASIIAPNSAATAYYLGVQPARYMATPPTLTDTYTSPLLLDISGNLKTTASADIPTTLTGGSKTVTATGTAEALGASLATKSIYIRAKSTNTGNVFVGDSTVDATTSQQIILAANDAITIDISNRATVYVDVSVNGEGVDYLCMS